MFDLTALLPSPPEQTHQAERARLPAFTRGERASRFERARAYLAQARALVEAQHRAGMSGLSVCRLIAESMDRLLAGLFFELREELAKDSELALSALGGYGRKELAPWSDVDLLLLCGERARDEKVRALAGAFTTLLWDLKLTVGWSVRTAEESARAAEGDHTVRTALLDCRYVAGSEALYESLAGGVLRELLTQKADAFIADKRRELLARREKFGDSLYVLEPNVKLSEGGLRDLEAALWIAQARFRTRGLTELLRQSVLPASEVATLKAARDFLLRIRNHMHYLRGRKEDRLTFDLQEEVARFLGYQSSEREGLPVEQFMRHYYLSAKAIRRAADALIARCEERSDGRRRHAADRRIGAFKVFGGRLTLEGDAQVLRDSPKTVLELFRVAEEEGLPLYSWARDQVALALPHLEAANGAPEVVEALKALFARPGTRGQFLFEMHEVGALGAVLPEFGRITAHHTHDLYHVYTVDLHSLFAVRRLFQLRAGDLAADEPAKTRIMQELGDPLPLYLGMLLHDVGKGLGGDHSAKGAELAKRVCARLLLNARQTEIVVFLVLRHLDMSHTAQRRDLSDPDLVAEFAESCGDVEKLTCLYLLTYADICSVGPNLWNDWKAHLLEELFQKSRAHLLGGPADAEGLLAKARARFASKWSATLGEAAAAELLGALPDRYFLNTEPSRAFLHARLLDRVGKLPLVGAIRQGGSGSTELSLCAPDRPGLLAVLTGVLAAHRIDILGARILSTNDGRALDVFDVQGPLQKPLERSRWRAARADLLRVLRGEVTVDEVLKRRRTTSLLSRPLPKVPTHVSIDNRSSARFTIVDVRAEDRVGLLHAIASALSERGLDVSLAKVATEAHCALDAFYVTRGGRKVTDPAEVDQLAQAVKAAIDAFGEARW